MNDFILNRQHGTAHHERRWSDWSTCTNFSDCWSNCTSSSSNNATTTSGTSAASDDETAVTIGEHRRSTSRSSSDGSIQRQERQEHPNEYGIIFASNKAYQDLLDGTLPLGSKELADVCTLSSSHSSECDSNGSTLSFFHRHVLYYRGQVIWRLETHNHIHPTCTWGVSSTCTLTPDNVLMVDLFQQGRRSVTVMGHEFHKEQRRRVCIGLKDILGRAAMLCQPSGGGQGRTSFRFLQPLVLPRDEIE